MFDVGLSSTIQAGYITTGVSEWKRERPLSFIQKLLYTLHPYRLIRTLVRLRHKINSSFHPCRASTKASSTDPDPLLFSNFMERLIPYCLPYTEFPDKPWRKDVWYLNVLAIHPGHPGKGFGRQLVDAGLQRARREGVPSVVFASEGNDTFYRRVEFRELVSFNTHNIKGQPPNPLKARGVGGGAVFWTWAKGDEGLYLKAINRN